jgi:anionic cell wall polymer biosynthesis LytR-Cps2A-Psr (LCP) family protein
MAAVVKVEYGTDMSEREQQIGLVLNRPYVQLALVVVLLLILTILVIKLGVSAWVMTQIGYERLVNGGGNPDFWTIGSELSAYKQSQVAPMQKETHAESRGNAAKKEHIVGNMGRIDQARLAALLA